MLKPPSDHARDLTTYHACDGEQIAKITNVREGAALMIQAITDNCPPCADRSAAIRNVRLALMEANAAIALKGMA